MTVSSLLNRRDLAAFGGAVVNPLRGFNLANIFINKKPPKGGLFVNGDLGGI